ncbi:uncharacterized protein [Watersipora subatra]|uniref:uncharacterized protein n=1 Tax=Watersipora subatra TaxID=2589382 RepID=UPI00355B1297
MASQHVVMHDLQGDFDRKYEKIKSVIDEGRHHLLTHTNQDPVLDLKIKKLCKSWQSLCGFFDTSRLPIDYSDNDGTSSCRSIASYTAKFETIASDGARKYFPKLSVPYRARIRAKVKHHKRSASNSPSNLSTSTTSSYYSGSPRVSPGRQLSAATNTGNSTVSSADCSESNDCEFEPFPWVSVSEDELDEPARGKPTSKPIKKTSKSSQRQHEPHKKCLRQFEDRACSSGTADTQDQIFHASASSQPALQRQQLHPPGEYDVSTNSDNILFSTSQLSSTNSAIRRGKILENRVGSHLQSHENSHIIQGQTKKWSVSEIHNWSCDKDDSTCHNKGFEEGTLEASCDSSLWPEQTLVNVQYPLNDKNRQAILRSHSSPTISEAYTPSVQEGASAKIKHTNSEKQMIENTLISGSSQDVEHDQFQSEYKCDWSNLEPTSSTRRLRDAYFSMGHQDEITTDYQRYVSSSAHLNMESNQKFDEDSSEGTIILENDPSRSSEVVNVERKPMLMHNSLLAAEATEHYGKTNQKFQKSGEEQQARKKEVKKTELKACKNNWETSREDGLECSVNNERFANEAERLTDVSAEPLVGVVKTSKATTATPLTKPACSGTLKTLSDFSTLVSIAEHELLDSVAESDMPFQNGNRASCVTMASHERQWPKTDIQDQEGYTSLPTKSMQRYEQPYKYSAKISELEEFMTVSNYVQGFQEGTDLIGPKKQDRISGTCEAGRIMCDSAFKLHDSKVTESLSEQDGSLSCNILVNKHFQLTQQSLRESVKPSTAYANSELPAGHTEMRDTILSTTTFKPKNMFSDPHVESTKTTCTPADHSLSASSCGFESNISNVQLAKDVSGQSRNDTDGLKSVKEKAQYQSDTAACCVAVTSDNRVLSRASNEDQLDSLVFHDLAALKTGDGNYTNRNQQPESVEFCAVTSGIPSTVQTTNKQKLETSTLHTPAMPVSHELCHQSSNHCPNIVECCTTVTSGSHSSIQSTSDYQPEKGFSKATMAFESHGVTHTIDCQSSNGTVCTATTSGGHSITQAASDYQAYNVTLHGAARPDTHGLTNASTNSQSPGINSLAKTPSNHELLGVVSHSTVASDMLPVTVETCRTSNAQMDSGTITSTSPSEGNCLSQTTSERQPDLPTFCTTMTSSTHDETCRISNAQLDSGTIPTTVTSTKESVLQASDDYQLQSVRSQSTVISSTYGVTCTSINSSINSVTITTAKKSDVHIITQTTRNIPSDGRIFHNFATSNTHGVTYAGTSVHAGKPTNNTTAKSNTQNISQIDSVSFHTGTTPATHNLVDTCSNAHTDSETIFTISSSENYSMGQTTSEHQLDSAVFCTAKISPTHSGTCRTSNAQLDNETFSTTSPSEAYSPSQTKSEHQPDSASFYTTMTSATHGETCRTSNAQLNSETISTTSPSEAYSPIQTKSEHQPDSATFYTAATSATHGETCRTSNAQLNSETISTTSPSEAYSPIQTKSEHQPDSASFYTTMTSATHGATCRTSNAQLDNETISTTSPSEVYSPIQTKSEHQPDSASFYTTMASATHGETCRTSNAQLNSETISTTSPSEAYSSIQTKSEHQPDSASFYTTMTSATHGATCRTSNAQLNSGTIPTTSPPEAYSPSQTTIEHQPDSASFYTTMTSATHGETCRTSNAQLNSGTISTTSQPEAYSPSQTTIEHQPDSASFYTTMTSATHGETCRTSNAQLVNEAFSTTSPSEAYSPTQTTSEHQSNSATFCTTMTFATHSETCKTSETIPTTVTSTTESALQSGNDYQLDNVTSHISVTSHTHGVVHTRGNNSQLASVKLPTSVTSDNHIITPTTRDHQLDPTIFLTTTSSSQSETYASSNAQIGDLTVSDVSTSDLQSTCQTNSDLQIDIKTVHASAASDTQGKCYTSSSSQLNHMVFYPAATSDNLNLIQTTGDCLTPYTTASSDNLSVTSTSSHAQSSNLTICTATTSATCNITQTPDDLLLDTTTFSTEKTDTHDITQTTDELLPDTTTFSPAMASATHDITQTSDELSPGTTTFSTIMTSATHDAVMPNQMV